MIDWKPGDKLVAIKTGEDFKGAMWELPTLTIGRQYKLRYLEFSIPDCPECESQIVVCLVAPYSERFGYCSCMFRKPLDLNRLFSVHTSKPVKETADA